MSNESLPPTAASLPGTGRGADFGGVFFEGLPMMIGIVTAITQPFAQTTMQEMFRLPNWLPIFVALVVSGVLAVYRLAIVRGSRPKEYAICAPLLALLIFSGYVTGNNAVHYAKEGITKSGAGSQEKTGGEIDILREQNQKLLKQLQRADKLLEQIGKAIGISGSETKSEGMPGKTKSSFLGMFIAGAAHAAEPVTAPTKGATDPSPRMPTKIERQELNQALKDYLGERKAFDKELKELKTEEQKAKDSPSIPLIKSW
jgi:hypothetical protein